MSYYDYIINPVIREKKIKKREGERKILGDSLYGGKIFAAVREPIDFHYCAEPARNRRRCCCSCHESWDVNKQSNLKYLN